MTGCGTFSVFKSGPTRICDRGLRRPLHPPKVEWSLPLTLAVLAGGIPSGLIVGIYEFDGSNKP